MFISASWEKYVKSLHVTSVQLKVLKLVALEVLLHWILSPCSVKQNQYLRWPEKAVKLGESQKIPIMAL